METVSKHGTSETHASLNVSSGTIDNELEDDECIELIVREPSPNRSMDDNELASAKKKGKMSVCGKN
jgi:hypothetical protein